MYWIDPFGLSKKDVDKIMKQYHMTVTKMTKNGQRMDPGWLNNINRSLYDASNGHLGHKYKGCWEQADTVKDKEQSQKYDDKWTFTVTGSNWPQIDYDNHPTIDHWWVTGKSSNPSDPKVILDPWRNKTRLK